MICFMWVVVGPNFIDVQFYLRQQTDRLGDIIHVTGDTYANVDRAIFHLRHKSVILWSKKYLGYIIIVVEFFRIDCKSAPF